MTTIQLSFDFLKRNLTQRTQVIENNELILIQYAFQ